MPQKTLREHMAEMTGPEIADALGASQSAAWMVRAGRRSVTLRRLRSFMEHVGADRLDLVLTIHEEAARADEITRRRRADREH